MLGKMKAMVAAQFGGLSTATALKAAGNDRAWIEPMVNALRAKPSPAATAASVRIETLRAALAARVGGVPIYYSPKPGAYDHASGERPEHGTVMTFSYAQAAKTGVGRAWGQAMFELTRARKPATILELGACAGISGSYMAAGAPDATLITIEASRELAEIAAEHIGQFTHNAEVMNALFDAALDALDAKPPRIDLAYIDGHHEKEATLHYYARIRPMLAPGAIVLFDDIRWSQDMNDCWQAVRAMPDFELLIDMAKLGLAVFNPGAATRYVDLSGLGPRDIGTPHGWA